jgi:hypothetical protein
VRLRTRICIIYVYFCFHLFYHASMSSPPLSGLCLPAFQCFPVCLLQIDAPPLIGELSVICHAQKCCRVFRFVCFVNEIDFWSSWLGILLLCAVPIFRCPWHFIGFVSFDVTYGMILRFCLTPCLSGPHFFETFSLMLSRFLLSP